LLFTFLKLATFIQNATFLRILPLFKNGADKTYAPHNKENEP